MKPDEIKEIYPKLRKADKYLVIAFDEKKDEATCSMDMSYDQCDMVVTWLIEKMQIKDQMQ